jgi:hypothetical protein
MKADYILGICVDNEDPQNSGRIRALPLTELGVYSTLGQLKTYLANQDIKSENGKIYKPWYKTKTSPYIEKDRFLCEPFLPKNITVPPYPGQLVKILTYDDNQACNEFIGPYTIDQVTLTEEFRNVVLNLQKTNNLKEVLPQYGKMFLSGYKNEQVILGNDEIIFRLAHINQDLTRKQAYPFIQLSQFNQSYDLKKETVTVIEDIDIPLDGICQLYIDYAPKKDVADKNFTGTLILFNAQKIKNEKNQIGLTSKTYSNTKTYVAKNDSNFLVKYVINTTTLSDLRSIIDTIINSLSTNGVISYYATKNPDGTNASTTQKIVTDKHIINVFNNTPNEPNAGGASDTENHNIVTGLKNWIYRLTPGTTISNYRSGLDLSNPPNLPPDNINMVNYNNYKTLETFINANKEERRFGNQLNNSTKTSTYEKNIPKASGSPLSVNMVYCDKFLFLSSLNSPSIIDDTTNDGIPSHKIAEYFNNTNLNVKTYGWVRGEKIMELLNEMMEMFSRHGHEAGKDPRASITQTTIEDLDKIKKKIKDELTPNQNNVILNHNLRFN